MCGARKIWSVLPPLEVAPLSQPGAPAAVPDRDPRERIGDTERDALVEQLGCAYAEGYLDRPELETRTERALRSTTGRELTELRRDLPEHLDPAVVARAVARHAAVARGARTHLVSYAGGVALMLAIWLVAAIAFGATYFWPVWPILGWGIGVASHVLPVRRQLASGAGGI